MNSLLSLFDKVRQEDTYDRFFLFHEPLRGHERQLEEGKDYLLFGHIHGRQKVKKFGLDVGVDGNNYEPYSIDDIHFYANALDKGYYDAEVFSK